MRLQHTVPLNLFNRIVCRRAFVQMEVRDASYVYLLLGIIYKDKKEIIKKSITIVEKCQTVPKNFVAILFRSL